MNDRKNFNKRLYTFIDLRNSAYCKTSNLRNVVLFGTCVYYVGLSNLSSSFDIDVCIGAKGRVYFNISIND